MNTNDLIFKMTVSFSPSSVTGEKVQTCAEKTGAKLLGGSSHNGMLIYQAQGASIGEFRDAIKTLGLRAYFTK